MKAFCDSGSRLRPFDRAADFKVAPGGVNGSPVRDFTPVSEGASEQASNGHADLAKVFSGSSARLSEDGRNGAAKPVVEADRIDIPDEAPWQGGPALPEPAVEERGAAVLRLHSERGAARRH
jgi:hypothetical protein